MNFGSFYFFAALGFIIQPRDTFVIVLLGPSKVIFGLETICLARLKEKTAYTIKG